jgi:uncharacterized protein YjiS (DUF1127 family)
MSALSLTSIIALSPRNKRTIGLLTYLALWQQRRALATMDERQLRDIGVTRAEALAEAARPVWDAPANWTN